MDTTERFAVEHLSTLVHQLFEKAGADEPVARSPAAAFITGAILPVDGGYLVS